MRTREKLKMAEKHCTSPSPHSLLQCETSDQSNWASSPGAVTIRVEAAGAAENLGPRIGVEVPGHADIGAAHSPAALISSKTLVASSRGAVCTIAAISAAQCSSMTGTAMLGPPLRRSAVAQPAADGARVIAGLLGDLFDAHPWRFIAMTSMYSSWVIIAVVPPVGLVQ